ncbi:tetratricopeptide repeat protein [Luteimonas sp. RD2P54]|uniref:Tetratricopeptide repeat protein n=1 Tax=Luteimonas endophytica TaxID=3042023 RepID=A0ABT6JA90_9GAMM|nr:tetratricopeptide repeat protein [Luteimonas endophytica]MDH5823737.1 tetratricopeptide repeat protein [Luteimonas endophytica]
MMQLALAALLALPIPLPDSTPPSHAQVLEIPPELRAQLHQRVPGSVAPGARRLELLVEFVFSADGLALEYGNSTTHTVADAWRTRQVNCLSFALLFTGLAREVGLDAYVQEIDQVLAWHQQGGIVYNSSHVNVGVRFGQRRKTVDVSRAEVMARHRPEQVADERALAHFYNNRGAELMAAGDSVAARRHMEEAIALDPRYATSWNNLGVLRMRSDDAIGAEAAYREALALDPTHASALFNIVGLFRRAGDEANAMHFQRRLERAQLADPFHQFLLGTQYEGRGEYERAVEHYRRAIRLHGDEHRFHFALARTWLLMGERRRAGRALARARELGDDDSRALYQAKLDRLRQDR